MATRTMAGERPLYFADDRSLLEQPCVAIVGSRDATELGILRARRLARELVRAGVVVVSGLARGIDVAAHREAIRQGGRTVAVIGTHLERAYPSEHRALQAEIAEHHLLVSPFAPGTKLTRASFPMRNRVMAALCRGTIVVEADDQSGTLHQAKEAIRLGRELFLCASLVSNPDVTWPRRFASPRTHVLTSTEQVLERLRLEAA